jgi:L-lactate dehydrogenase complex protein LldF
MKLAAYTFADRARYEQAQKLARLGQGPLARNGIISSLPGPLAGWSTTRDLPAVPAQSFRDWWRTRT